MTKPSTGFLFAIGMMVMFVALFFQTVTLAHGNYAPILLIALGLAAAADACFLVVYLRGPRLWRYIAIITMTPTAFIIFDFLRRVPPVFGL